MKGLTRENTFFFKWRIKSSDSGYYHRIYQQLATSSLNPQTQRVPTVQPTVRLYTSRRERAGFHQKGSSGEGLNWAMRSPWQRGPPRCRAWGVVWEGVSCWSGLKWRESLFTCFLFFLRFLGDSHGRGPSTHSNELFTHTHSHTFTHTHTHHYITDNNSYITGPRGHWGNYNALTSVPAGQINTNT